MNIAFIGLGAVGAAMVERLLLANYAVTNFTFAESILAILRFQA